MDNNDTKTGQATTGTENSQRPDLDGDLHHKTVLLTVQLTGGMVLELLKRGAPLEAILEGQIRAVMQTAMSGFQLTAGEAAELVVEVVEGYRDLDIDSQPEAVALQ